MFKSSATPTYTNQATARPAEEKPKAQEASPKPRPNAPKGNVQPSMISADLHITGNITTTGNIEVNGVVEGDIRANLLTIGEKAEVRGEVIAEDVVIHGKISGCVRGLKVRLSSTARVEGDIIHKTIAIESGADFEGRVQRQDDPLSAPSRNQSTVQ